MKYNNRMVCRIWHGYTAFGNADAYEKLLKEEIFVHIRNREIKGFKGIQLLKRPRKKEVEFITLMWFDSITSVKEFAGEDFAQAVVPDKARKLLVRFDKRSSHYEVLTHDM